MGFYAPAEIVRCAREHQVPVLAPDAAFSDWDCTLERNAEGELCLRLGLRQIDGFREEDADAIMDKRGYGYRDFADFARRTGTAATGAGDPGRSRCLSRLRAGPPRRLVGGAAAARRYAAAAVRAARRAGTGRRNTSRPCR